MIGNGKIPKIARSVSEVRTAQRELVWPAPNKCVAFVPTMGALHDGHLSLVRKARKELNANIVVVSIFVNPAQFGPTEDFAIYPRGLEDDIKLLASVEGGVDLVFAPDAPELYPPAFSTIVSMASFTGEEDPAGAEVLRRAKLMAGTADATTTSTKKPKHEAASRPHMFSGVATVVAKLFNIVRPTHAIFGQKDALQCAVIRRLIEDLNFEIDLVIAPTFREPSDSVAMSSRNRRLSPQDRTAATIIPKALLEAEKLFNGGLGEKRRDILIQVVDKTIRQAAESSQVPMQLLYVSLARAYDMEEIPQDEIPHGVDAVLSLAAVVGNTRLIDNVVLHWK